MAAESTFSENLDSRNRGRAEPKKKLKKRRSIRVSRMPSLKPRSKSRFDWPPSDLSSDASSLLQASSIALSDSAPNYMKSTSSFMAKKESPQGGSECDDVNSVVSSSCGSSDRVVHPFISISDDAAMPQHPSSIEVSDASPSYVEAKRWPGGNKGHFQSSPCDSESSYDSNDQTKSSHASESNSVHFSRKSLNNPSRISSSGIRNARVLVKKASFKPKRNSSRSSQISADSHVDKATCSSIIKDSRFPEHVDLQAGETEADRISFVKVCPYHHCSLNGHSHDLPPKEHSSSHGRRQSLKPQISKKPRSVTEPKVKPANGKKEGVKRHQTNSNKEAPIQQGALVQRETVKAFYTEKGIILETCLGSYNMKMDVNESISPDFVAELEGSENSASSVGAHGKNLTLHGENIDLPHTNSSEMFKTLDNPVDTSCETDATLNREPTKNVPFELERNSISRTIGEATLDETVTSPVSDSHTSQDLSSSMEETNRNLKPDMALTAAFTPDGDSEYKLQNPDRDSEPPLPSEVQNHHFNKGRHISMWHLIQKHMASGISAEDTTKPLQGANEENKVEEAKTDPAKDSSDTYMEPSYSDLGIENRETANQEIEVRKLFAIKLVRDAIEKILLPEVQDQSSETQSITSEIVEDQEIPEKNQQGPGNGCPEGNGNSITGGNTAADPGVLDHTEDSLSGQEEKKQQTKSWKKSDKKSPSNWSNLKRWILLQRFVKELEKVRKFNPSKPRHLQLEPGPESEKVNLRHQTVDERRRAEEWMLDYALRQVVSELAPTQKKKVALLVKAFETVVPPQEDHNIGITLPNLKDESHEDAFITKKEDLSTEMEARKSHTEENNMDKTDDWQRSSVPEGHGTAKSHYRPLDDNTQSSTDPCLRLDSIINSCEEVPENAESKQEPSANLIGDSAPISISISQHTVADTIPKNREHIAHSTLQQQVPAVVNREFPPTDLKIPGKENESGQSQLDKQNYIRMWHMVYQHVASAIATKVGSELLGGEGEEVEDANYLAERDTSGLHVDPANGSYDGVNEDHKASHLQSEFSKIDAVKLVQEAVNEILEDTSDTQSITSETSLDQELSEHGHREVEKQSISSSNSLTKENINKFEGEGGFSFDEVGSRPDIVSTQEKRAVSPDKNEPYPRKMKNWSKLKNLMLLKRSIKAMEKARELKSQSQQLLSLSSDPQPEKVDLRQQMIDERKKAEQWMLDYAVQHIVTKLTPARKRRVAMLVEAFEAVVPLPAV